MRGTRFGSALVVALLALVAASSIQSAPLPRDKPTIQLTQAGKVKLADLTINDAAIIDDSTVAVVGRKGEVEAPPPMNEGEPNGAIIDLPKKSARSFTNEHTKQIWG